MGNAIYRGLIQALVMVEMDYLMIVVPEYYSYQTSGRKAISRDYDNIVSVARVQALSDHSYIAMPVFTLCNWLLKSRPF